MSHKKMQTDIAKKVKAIVALLMLFSAVCAVPASSAENSSGPPRIMVIPERIVDPTLRPGKNFSISIYTDYDGWDVAAYQFTLSYDPNILHGGIEKTDWDTWTGDNVTRTFNATKKRIVPHSEEVYVDNFLMTRYTERTDIWTGDGVTTSFITTEKPVVPKSEMIYVNKSYAKPNVEYMIDYTAGNITFFTAPEDGVQIEVEYTYGHYNIECKTGEITFTTAPALGTEVKARYLYGGVVNGDLIVGGSALFVAGTFNNTEGKLSLTVGLFVEEGEFNTGPGTLANVTFTVAGRGKSNITIGPQTKLFGWDIFEWPPHAYVIIDAETMPDQIQHGFFANIGSGGNGVLSGGTTSLRLDARGMTQTNVQASESPYYQQEPMPEPIIMWAVVTPDPYWGAYGGYHDVLFEIREELIKIGIDLRIRMLDGPYWREMIWEDKWNVPGDADNNPGVHTYGVDGWDFFVSALCLSPTSYTGFDELVYSWLKYPTGWNIMPWNNSWADYYYHIASTAVDPETGEPDRDEHITYMHLWQKEFMHDPPGIPIYYADIMTAQAAYLEGYDHTSWLYELTQVRINQSVFDAVAPPARKAVGSDTLLWGAAEPIWSWNPLWTLYCTEEMMSVMTKGLLYRNSREYMETEPPSGNHTVIPTVASDFPTWHTCSELGYTYEEDYPVARVPIREGIVWTDGVPFNATDVAFTFNMIITAEAGGYAYGTYVDLIREAVAYNATTVDFIMYEYDYDWAGYNAHGSGLGWLPYHQLRDVEPRRLKCHETNFDPIPVSLGGKGLECIGPYVPINEEPNVMVELARIDVAVERAKQRGEYTGTLPDGYSWTDYYWWDLGWGHGACWQLPKYFISEYIPDAVSRNIALQKLEVDFCEYPIAPVETWQGMEEWDTHKVLTYNYPATNHLWFNLDNPILSNRYVRQAIAHAIPYPRIFSEILPGWGVSKVYPGKTYVTPWHESWANDAVLEPYTYDIEVAQQYMDMWRYSQVDTDHTLGPVGDADLGGDVRIHDFPIWVEGIGRCMPIPRLPGQDIDPDHDNTDYVDADDFLIWRANRGEEYPFPGAR